MSSSAYSQPCFTIFGGPNGSGKSTAYDRFLQAGFDSGEYLNPDEIARSLNAGSAAGTAVDLRAGREVVQRTRSLIAEGRSLVRESTLTSREIVRSAERAKAVGYRLVMVFVAVSSSYMTQGRVAIRVAKGGHDIPVEAQERRFPRSFENAPRVARLVDAAYSSTTPDSGTSWSQRLGAGRSPFSIYTTRVGSNRPRRACRERQGSNRAMKPWPICARRRDSRRNCRSAKNDPGTWRRSSSRSPFGYAVTAFASSSAR